MTLLILLTSIVYAIAVYIDKYLVEKGISRKDYFYYMCFSMIPFSALMIVFDYMRMGVIRFELNWIPFAILIAAMALRYIKQHAIVGCYQYLNPHESMAYMSLGIILAFVIDCLLGVKNFTLSSVISIVLTLYGVFLLSDARLRIKALQKDLLLRIACEVGLGYVAHFLLKYWDNAIYILVLNVALTACFSRGYTLEYHKSNKTIIKWVFIQQTFGFACVYLENYLSAIAVTLSSYVRPISITLAVIVLPFLNKGDRTLRMRDVVAVLLVAAGVALI